MAIGIIEQHKGPFETTDAITLGGNACKISISISEDDFMSWQAKYDQTSESWHGEDFVFKITNEGKERQIHMGRTYMYQTQNPVNQPITISFPKGAPTSLTVDVVYSQDYIEE